MFFQSMATFVGDKTFTALIIIFTIIYFRMRSGTKSYRGRAKRCASCGATERDDNDIQLKDCSACHLVRYCGDKCQKEHRPTHKEACKKDEMLFKQPVSSHLGDCPICMLPLSLDQERCTMMACCSQMICDGCFITNQKREVEEKLDPKCPFCRKLTPNSTKGASKSAKDRLKMKDPVAMRQEGMDRNVNGDYRGAFQYLSKAAKLGNVAAHCELAGLYHFGNGVKANESKKLYHNEQAAIGGHPVARHNLGCEEMGGGNIERAVKHLIIAAKLGYDLSLEFLKELYKDGLVSKDDFAAALRGHKAAVDATKSPQRDAAVSFGAWYGKR